MEVLVFKTNIRYKKEIKNVRKHLDDESQIIKWNIDLHDIDKILRIVVVNINPGTVESLIHKAGHVCEELKD